MQVLRTLAPIAAALCFAASAQAQTLIGGGGKAVTNFPIVISQSGSYKLAGNLNVPAGLDAIQIAAGLQVTLDLGGYTIAGGYSCSKASCNAGALTIGVRANASSVRIFNGAVRGFSLGIGNEASTANPALFALSIEDLTVTGNGSGISGMVVMARRVVAQNNYLYGISASHGTLESCIATSNGGPGIRATFGSVRNNQSKQNGGAGFELSNVTADGNVSLTNAQPNVLSGVVQGLNSFN